MRSLGLRWATLAIGVLTIFWLGYAAGRVQNIVDVSRLYRDADTERYSLTRAGVLVHFERMGGAGKPYVRTADGVELLDVSDWDRGSRIVVDGTGYELVRLFPSSSADYERYRLVSTLHGEGWLLEREVTLTEDGTVRVDHTFIARRPIQRVDLALAHTHFFFSSVDLSGGGVSATVSRLSREQILAGMRAESEYRVRITPEGPGLQFRAGDGGSFGPSSFIADLGATRPAPDQRTPIGTEVIRVERLGG